MKLLLTLLTTTFLFFSCNTVKTYDRSYYDCVIIQPVVIKETNPTKYSLDLIEYLDKKETTNDSYWNDLSELASEIRLIYETRFKSNITYNYICISAQDLDKVLHCEAIIKPYYELIWKEVLNEKN